MKNRHKGLLLILDGLGDRGVAAFDGKTPLEAANTPNMDALIKSGQGALIDPLFPGVPVGTHTGTGVLFGIPPLEIINLTRGPVEAAGIELPVMLGDILIRCNFATLEPQGAGFRILDRRAGRIARETEKLCQELENVALDGDIRATLSPATQHRAVLRLTGSDLSAAISNTDPGSGFLDQGVLRSVPQEPGEAAAKTANALNRFTEIAYEVLNDHPVNQGRRRSGLPVANGVVCRSAGVRIQPNSLAGRLGLQCSLIAGDSTVIGLGRLLHYKIISDPSFTSLPVTNLEGKFSAARQALKESELVFLHIKGPDICGHDKDPTAKKKLLEAIDRELPPLISEDMVIGITGDHSTDSNSGNHVGDPVPALLHSPEGRRDGCASFGEADCSGGGLGRVSATGFLCAMLDEMGYMHKFKPGDAQFFTLPR